MRKRIPLFILFGLGAIRAQAQAAPGAKQTVLPPAEAKAVATCLDIIRGCQLPDGAFVQVNHGGAPEAPVWIAPYFVDYAAIALLAEYKRTKRLSDLASVGKWLAWCAMNQADDGYWNDYEGTVAVYKNNGKVDAWDSSAALFLLVAGKYQQAGGKVTPRIVTAARKALRCIETVSDRDGLTWATPTYKVKFLMDNVEVYAGLQAASELFAAAGEKAEAGKASAQADRIRKKLPGYWRPADRLFAYALHPNGIFEGGLDKAYPQGLAQLFGCAFIAPKPEAWAAVKKFPPDGGPSAALGAERWLTAAARFGGDDAREWRAKTAAEAAGFTPLNVYIYRPAVTALALLEGADWMPNIAGAK